MTRIAIQDANILIDLVNIGLFSHCLALKYEFSTTALIFHSELNQAQVEIIRLHINAGAFHIIEISETELLEIQFTSREDRRLSEQDWSVIYYAKKQNALLLSGDRVLKNVAVNKTIEVRGILWLFDQLVSEGIITKMEACNFLQKLMGSNRRLPASECQKRINQWCGK